MERAWTMRSHRVARQPRAARASRSALLVGLMLLVLLASPQTAAGAIGATSSAPAVPTLVAASTRPGPADLGAALAWLQAQQQSDGGFGLPASSGSVTADAALAFAAAGIDVSMVRRGERSLLDYLLTTAPAYSATPAGAAKLTLTAIALGQSPRSFGGVDLVAAMGNPDTTGRYGRSLYEHAFYLMALGGVGEPVAPMAINYLLTSQIADGSWGFAGPGRPGDGDTNTTAIALQALRAVNAEYRVAAEKALVYLLANQTPEGGFSYSTTPGQSEPADANSTAVVLQALLSLDVAPGASTSERATARLAAFQNPSGSFRWKDDVPEDNLFALLQAIPALTQRYLPFSATDASGPRSRRLAARPLDGIGPGEPDRRFFTATGHSLAFGFKGYWENNGGLAIFGLPLTEEFQEFNPADGNLYTVQYFERARFEYHPEHRGTPFEVQLGLLGRQISQGTRNPAFVPSIRLPSPDCLLFPTGHPVCGEQASFWRASGGLAILGQAISTPFEEDGASVQYFERARIERREAVMTLGLVGREILYGR